MNDHTGSTFRELDDIEDLLEAYAEARLSPSGPVLARVRANVMAKVAGSAALAATGRRAGEADAPAASRERLSHVRVPRRAFALGLAATLTLGTGAAVLAAPPGSPLYDVRVAIEAALLPTRADARLASHEQHLEQRIAEALAAAEGGDPVALQAALAAYAAEVEVALNELGSDPDLLARLEAVLGKHVAVLTALEAEVPDQASIDRAIESSRKAVAKIKERGESGAGRSSSVPIGPDTPGRD